MKFLRSVFSIFWRDLMLEKCDTHVIRVVSGKMAMATGATHHWAFVMFFLYDCARLLIMVGGVFFNVKTQYLIIRLETCAL